MTNAGKNVFGMALYGICAAALGAGVTIYAGAATSAPSKDSADVLEIRNAYVSALNSGDASALMGYLDSNLQATMATGEEIKSAAEFKAYVEKMRDLIGLDRGGSYQILSIDTAKKSFFSDMAYAHGTTREKVEAVDKKGKKGQLYEYESEWEAWLRKGADGKWKLISGKINIDPKGRAFTPQALAKIKALANSYKKS